MDFGDKFETGLEYTPFLERYANEDQLQRWQDVLDRIAITSEQQAILLSFVREMKVLVLAGTWCGDCVNQLPILEHFARVNSLIRIRYFDRDDNPDLGEHLMTCGAVRVPAVLFLSEDNHVCGRYGDRTLARYRQMASQFQGNACSTGIVADGDSVFAETISDWCREFERIQLMLRTSGRLRQKHGD